MSTIEKARRVLRLINEFTVEPEKQQKLITVLIAATEQTMKHMPGFVSANIYRSLNGEKDMNFPQRESMAVFESMRTNPKAIPHMQAVAALAQFGPILCEVADAISLG
jgi:hypothetical protein